MSKKFEIPPNNGKYSLFLRPLLQDAETVYSFDVKIFTSNELIQSNEQWTEYVDGLWKQYCSNESGDISKEEAAKLFIDNFNCTPAEFESYF